jgi:hypothetical protein
MFRARYAPWLFCRFQARYEASYGNFGRFLFDFGRFQRGYALQAHLVSRFLGWYGTLFGDCTRICQALGDEPGLDASRAEVDAWLMVRQCRLTPSNPC